MKKTRAMMATSGIYVNVRIKNSGTYLVFASFRGSIVLAGYFTLAYKDFTISVKSIGRNLRDRIKKFGRHDCIAKV